ncbi:MAG TPA: BatA and WFA domain-containing protein [Pirellulales bacterium]|jgi:hypothetical protein|nr:BatA and WFA domain-containing protein [Pirellulales bacterium]
MFFALPWMLLGLLGVPALAAIYWLRSRAKLRTVSSIFLWMDQRQARQGGRIFQRLQTPLTFLLELLAIAAIVIAAAAPSVNRSRYARPLVLVLDDSYSMQAGGDASPRRRASEKLADEFRQTDYVARVILAGAQSRLLGTVVRSDEQFAGILDQWTCTAPTAGLESAIALASEIGGTSSRILVVSDHAPDGELPAGKVEWWGFGQPRSNIAITAATRDTSLGGADGQNDRVLLEVTNFGTAPARAELTLEGAGLDTAGPKLLQLDAGAASRMILNLAADSGELRARLSRDELAIDNEVVLVSPRRRPLRVQLSLAAGKSAMSLRAMLVHAFEACGQAMLVESRPDLVVTDSDQPDATDAWQLQILRRPAAVSYEGPFVLDRSHPLTEGLSLDAIIWSAARELDLTGTPIITAGNRVLMADSEDSAGRHKLQMVLEPELSNLTGTPDWPILVANLARWCLGATPGPAASNVRLGQTLRISLASDAAAGNAVVTLPSGLEQSLPIHGKHLEVHPDHIGLYNVRAGSMQFPFACNAVNGDESNLANCVSGQWGDWNDSEVFQDQQSRLDWAFVLVALGCLTVEMAIVSRAGAAGS